MSARVLRGTPIADEIKAEVASDVADLQKAHGFTPCLVAVRVGDDPASSVYVSSKIKTAAALGLISYHRNLSAAVAEEELAEIVGEPNARDDVDGIPGQMPLPKHINERRILALIDPEKEVDGLHPV